MSPVSVQKKSPIIGGLGDGHHAVAVHDGLQRFQGIHLCDNHVGPHAVGPHGKPPGTPAIAADNEDRARNQAVRRTNDAVECALARPVAVVEHVLGLGVVHGDDGKAQNPALCHGPKPDDACRRLFRPSDDAADQVLALRVDHRNEIGAVIHGQMRFHVQHGIDVAVIGFRILSLDRIDGDIVVLDKIGRYVILRAQGVRCAESHLGSPCLQGLHEACRLRGDVEACAQPEPLERLFLRETLPDLVQNGHALVGPFHAQFSLLRKLDVPDVVVHSLPFLFPAPSRAPRFISIWNAKRIRSLPAAGAPSPCPSSPRRISP